MQTIVQADVVLHKISPRSHSLFIESWRARKSKEMQYRKSANARFKTNVSTIDELLIIRRDYTGMKGGTYD